MISKKSVTRIRHFFQESDFSVLLCNIVGIDRIGKILVSDCSQEYAEFGNTNIFPVICIVLEESDELCFSLSHAASIAPTIASKKSVTAATRFRQPYVQRLTAS